MGFLRKDWDFESPAEHNMEAHDAYRDESLKESKPWLWVLALICGGLSIYSLYYIENTLYGGTINTSWAGWLGTFIGLLIIAAGGDFLKPKKEVENKWGKGEKIVGWILCGIVIIALFVVCWKMPNQRIYGFQFLSILPVAFGVDKARKAGASDSAINAWNFMLTFVLLSVMTFAAPKILGMTSVAEGEKLLRVEGYQGVYFDDKTMPCWLGKEMMVQAHAKLPQELEDAFVYLYGGAKDGKSYRILVDPYGRGILAIEENLPGTEVYNWLDD